MAKRNQWNREVNGAKSDNERSNYHMEEMDEILDVCNEEKMDEEKEDIFGMAVNQSTNGFVDENDKDDENEKNEGESEHSRSDDSLKSIESTSSSNDDSEEYSSSSSDGNSDSDQQSKDPQDNQPNNNEGLSEYEKLRLARIQRNQQKMAELGLLANAQIMKQPSQQRRNRPKPENAATPIPRRYSLTRTTKRNINNLDALGNLPSNPALRRSHSDQEKNFGQTSLRQHANQQLPSLCSDTNITETNHTDNKENSQDTNKKRKKPPASRLDMNIHREFVRIRSNKKLILKQAAKALANAEKEARYWEARSNKRERIQRRKKEMMQRQQEEQEALKKFLPTLGANSIKDALQHLDQRIPEFIRVAEKLRQEYITASRILEMDQGRSLQEQRAQITQDIEVVYPNALRNAFAVLDAVLQQRAPKDPPTPRRSKRNETEQNQPKHDKKVKNTPRLGTQPEPVLQPTPSFKPLLHSSTVRPVDEIEEKDGEDQEVAPIASKSVKKRIPRAKNVGGWISPDLAQRVDRQWLIKIPQSSDEFVPQVGDIVLYYPVGHKSFLDEFPDELGKKTRQLVRIPLWERAKQMAVGNKDEASTEKGIHSKHANTHNSEILWQKPSSSTTTTWWTSEWLDGMLQDYCSENTGPHLYPILCVVQATCPEFPPDSCIAMKKQNEDGTEEFFFKERDPRPGSPSRKNKKSKNHPKLRLAVTLRPLTPLPESSPSDLSKLSSKPLPPTFTVVMFPSSTQRQFLLPFGNTYSSSHKFRGGDHVGLPSSLRNGRLGQGRIVSFRSFENSLLASKIPVIRSLVRNRELRGRIATAPSESENIGNLSYADVVAVMDTLDSFLAREEPEDCEMSCAAVVQPFDVSSALWDLICSTLPIWDSITLTPESSLDNEDEDTFLASPWELIPAIPLSKQRSAKKNEPKRNPQLFGLDESLRLKLYTALEQLMNQHPSGDLFEEDPTSDIGPSYPCAVPVPMFFRRLLARLAGGAPLTTNEKDVRPCYYRSVGGLLSDVNLIRENCLLFNNPEAEVVEMSFDIVRTAKDMISRIVRTHDKELSEIRRADEQRQRLVMLHCGGTFSTLTHLQGSEQQISGDVEGGESVLKEAAIFRTKNPFRQAIYHEWLQQIHPSNSPIGTESEEAIGSRSGFAHGSKGPTLWIPQTGDRILYSRKRHALFIMNHYHSLETYQCTLPFTASESNTSTHDNTKQSDHEVDDDWKIGVVRWTRASFPKIPVKKSREDAFTFATSSTLLVVGMQFENSERFEAVYWRPCLFRFDGDLKESICGSCGLSGAESFLKPHTLNADLGPAVAKSCSKQNPPQSVVGDTESGAGPHGLSSIPSSLNCDPFSQSIGQSLPRCDADALHRCLILLKQKCMNRIRPSALDKRLTKASICDGYVPSQTEINLETIPTYGELVFQGSAGLVYGATHQVARENLAVHEELIAHGYVPPWLVSRETEETAPSWYETISPWSMMSLELVELRLRNGYYRHRVAVENDIVEAYSSICFLLLGRAGARKKAPISIRRVARLAAFMKLNGGTPLNHEGDVAKEEEFWAYRLAQVRDLYAAALVCISITKTVQRLHGLAPALQANLVNPLHEKYSSRFEARKKLGHLIYALRKDCLTKTLPPKTKFLKISLNGKTVSVEQDPDKITAMDSEVKIGQDDISMTEMHRDCADASFRGRDVKVRILCSEVELLDMPSITAGSGEVIRIRFDERDFDADESLARIFFGQPGRMKPCTRCQAHCRSFFFCRVRRGHFNFDFDWTSFFNEVGSLDNLLLQVDPTHAIKPKLLDNANECTTNGDILGLKAAPEKYDETAQPSSVHPSAEIAGQVDNGAEMGKVEADPDEMLRKAKSLVAKAKEIVRDAEKYAASTDLISRDFIESNFPVDESDGHYIYCIICGLEGDLLCCDGCPNVVHAGCVDLAIVPDGLWFCEQCHVDGKTSSDGPRTSSRAGVTMAQEPTAKSESPDKSHAYRQVYFDTKRVSNLAMLVRELQKTNPERQVENALPGNEGKSVRTNPFDALSSQAKEFLSSIGIKSAVELVKTGTSMIGVKYAEWRRINGQKEMKGDGNFATVRKWKKACRDAALLIGFDLEGNASERFVRKDVTKSSPENGVKTEEACSSATNRQSCPAEAQECSLRGHDDSLHALDANECSVRKDATDSSPENGSKTEVSHSNATNRLRGKIEAQQCSVTGHDDSLRLLDASAREFLFSIGIDCAHKLLELKTSDLARKFAEWRKEKSLPKPKGIGDVSTVNTWKTACRSSVVEPQRSRKSSENDFQEPKTQPVVSSRALRAGKRSRDAPVSPPKKVPGAVTRSKPRQDARKLLSCADALGVLSHPAREFLRSIKVTSADHFLSLNDWKVSESLGKWRQEQRLSKLQDSGNLAIVGAWRTLCRNALEVLRGSKRILTAEAEEASSEVSISEAEGCTPSRKKRKVGFKPEGMDVQTSYVLDEEELPSSTFKNC